MESKRYRRLYVSNARSRSGSRELRDLFSTMGKVVSYYVEDGEGYIEYSQDRDAEDALKKLNGQKFGDAKLNVEYACKSMNRPDYRSDSRRDRDTRDDRRDRYDRDERRDRRDRVERNDRGDRNDRGERRDRNDVKCFNCNEYGHIARHCDRKPQDSRRRRRSHSDDSREPRRRDNRGRDSYRDRTRNRRDDSEENGDRHRRNRRQRSESSPRSRNGDRNKRSNSGDKEIRNNNGNYNKEDDTKIHTESAQIGNNHSNNAETEERKRED
jgi:hypothetical protein